MGHNKSSFLSTPVEHIDITSFDARPIIESMSKMSFTSRERQEMQPKFLMKW